MLDLIRGKKGTDVGIYIYIYVCIWRSDSIWLDYVIAWDTWGRRARGRVSLPQSAPSVSGRCRWIQSSRCLWPDHIGSSRCFSSVCMFWDFAVLKRPMAPFLCFSLKFHWWIPRCCYSSSLAWNFQSLCLFSSFSGKILKQVEVTFGASLRCFLFFEAIFWNLRTQISKWLLNNCLSPEVDT